MSKYAVGESVDNAADAEEDDTIIAVFPTIDGNFRYVTGTEGCGAIQIFDEEGLANHRANLM